MFPQPQLVPISVCNQFQEIATAKYLINDADPKKLIAIFRLALLHAKEIVLGPSFFEKMKRLRLDPHTMKSIHTLTLQILLYPKFEKQNHPLIDTWISSRFTGSIIDTAQEITECLAPIAALPHDEKKEIINLCIPLWKHFIHYYSKKHFLHTIIQQPPLIRIRILKMIAPFLEGLKDDHKCIAEFLGSLNARMLPKLIPYAPYLHPISHGDTRRDILSELIQKPEKVWKERMETAKLLFPFTNHCYWADVLDVIEYVPKSDIPLLIQQTKTISYDAEEHWTIFSYLSKINSQDREFLVKAVAAYKDLIGKNVAQFILNIIVIDPEYWEEVLERIAGYYKELSDKEGFVAFVKTASIIPIEKWKLLLDKSSFFLKTYNRGGLFSPIIAELTKVPSSQIESILAILIEIKKGVVLEQASHQFSFYDESLHLDQTILEALAKIPESDYESVASFALRFIGDSKVSSYVIKETLLAWSKILPQNRESLLQAVTQSTFKAIPINQSNSVVAAFTSVDGDEIALCVKEFEIVLEKFPYTSIFTPTISDYAKLDRKFRQGFLTQFVTILDHFHCSDKFLEVFLELIPNYDQGKMIENVLKLMTGDKSYNRFSNILSCLKSCLPIHREELCSLCLEIESLTAAERYDLMGSLLQIKQYKRKGLLHTAKPLFLSGYPKEIKETIQILNSVDEAAGKELVEDALLFGGVNAVRVLARLKPLTRQKRKYLYEQSKKLFPEEYHSNATLYFLENVPEHEIALILEMAKPILDKKKIGCFPFLNDLDGCDPALRKELIEDLLLLPKMEQIEVNSMMKMTPSQRKGYLLAAQSENLSQIPTVPVPKSQEINQDTIDPQLSELIPYFSSCRQLNLTFKNIVESEKSELILHLKSIEKEWNGTDKPEILLQFFLSLHPSQRKTGCERLLALYPLADNHQELCKHEILQLAMRSNYADNIAAALQMHNEFSRFSKIVLFKAVSKWGAHQVKSFFNLFQGFRSIDERFLFSCLKKFEADALKDIYSEVEACYPYQDEPLPIEILELLDAMSKEKRRTVLQSMKKVLPVIPREHLKEMLVEIAALYEKNKLDNLELISHLCPALGDFKLAALINELGGIDRDTFLKGIKKAVLFPTCSVEDCFKTITVLAHISEEDAKSISSAFQPFKWMLHTNKCARFIRYNTKMNHMERLECAKMVFSLASNRVDFILYYKFFFSLSQEERKKTYALLLCLKEYTRIDKAILKTIRILKTLNVSNIIEWAPYFVSLSTDDLKTISLACRAGLSPQHIPSYIFSITADSQHLKSMVKALSQIPVDKRASAYGIIEWLKNQKGFHLPLISIILENLITIPENNWRVFCQMLVDGSKHFPAKTETVKYLVELYKKQKEIPIASFDTIFHDYPYDSVMEVLLIKLSHLSVEERLHIVMLTEKYPSLGAKSATCIWEKLGTLPFAEREEALVKTLPICNEHFTIWEAVITKSQKERNEAVTLFEKLQIVLSPKDHVFNDLFFLINKIPFHLKDAAIYHFTLLKSQIVNRYSNSLLKALFKIHDPSDRLRAIQMALLFWKDGTTIKQPEFLLALSSYPAEMTMQDISLLVEPFYRVNYDRDTFYELIIYFSYLPHAARNNVSYLVPLFQKMQNVEKLFSLILLIAPQDREQAAALLLHSPKKQQNIQQLYLKHPLLRERGYHHLTEVLERQKDPNLLAYLSKLIWEKRSEMLLHEEHPLVQKAYNTCIITRPEALEETNNPFVVYNKLKQLFKSEPLFEPDLKHYPFSLVIQTIRERAHVKNYTFADIPAEAHPHVFHQLVEDFKKRIDSLKAEEKLKTLALIHERTSKSFDELKEEFLKLPLIVQLLNATGKQEDSIEPHAYQLFMLMKALLKENNEISSPELLPPREQMLLNIFVSVSDCDTGQRDGITNAYNQLPLIYRTGSALPKPEARAAVVVAAAIQQFLEAICSSAEMIALCDPSGRSVQNPHIALLFKNRLGKHIGLQNFSIVFDPHTTVLRSQLIEAVNIFDAFMRCCTIEKAIPFVRRNIAEAFTTDMIRYMDVEYLLDPVRGKVPHDQLFEVEESGKPLGLTVLGARMLLGALKYLPATAPPFMDGMDRMDGMD